MCPQSLKRIQVLSSAMEKEYDSKIKRAWDSFRAAYIGRHDFYNKMENFMKMSNHPEHCLISLQEDKKANDRFRTACYAIDLGAVLIALGVGAPFGALAFVPSLFLRYAAAKKTKASINHWEWHKRIVLDNFYNYQKHPKKPKGRLIKPDRKDEDLKDSQWLKELNLKSDWSKEAGLDSIDDMFKNEEDPENQ